jgi:hypothetical protein
MLKLFSFVLISLFMIINVQCATVTPLTNVDENNYGPLPRENFAITINPFEHNSIFLFGGNFYDIGTTNVTFYNDLWNFQMVNTNGLTYYWELLNTTGDQPTPRSFHCLQTIGIDNEIPFILLIGGSEANIQNGNQTINNDFFYILDPQTLNWINMTSDAITDGFTKRSGSTCTAIQKIVYVYGGVDSNNNILNDLWIYNLTSTKWTFINMFPGEARWDAQFGLATINRGMYLFLFGGVNAFPIFQNGSLNITFNNILHDIWQFNTYNQTWTNISVGILDNYTPRRVGVQVFNSFTFNKFFQYGGNILNNTLSDNTIPPLNTTRYGLNSTACTGTQNGYTVPQMWSFDKRTSSWKNETLTLSYTPFNNTFIPPIANYKGLRIGNALIIMGGVISKYYFKKKY